LGFSILNDPVPFVEEEKRPAGTAPGSSTLAPVNGRIFMSPR